APARTQHAARLGERRGDVRDIAQAERDGISIDAAIADRQTLGIAAQPLDAGEAAPIDGAVAAAPHHALIDVADHGARAAAGAIEEAEGDVAGAAGDVEQRLARARIEPRHQLALP